MFLSTVSRLFSSRMPLSPPEKGTFEGVADESFLALVRWNVLLQLAMIRVAAVNCSPETPCNAGFVLVR